MLAHLPRCIRREKGQRMRRQKKVTSSDYISLLPSQVFPSLALSLGRNRLYMFHTLFFSGLRSSRVYKCMHILTQTHTSCSNRYSHMRPMVSQTGPSPFTWSLCIAVVYQGTAAFSPHNETIPPGIPVLKILQWWCQLIIKMQIPQGRILHRLLNHSYLRVRRV